MRNRDTHKATLAHKLPHVTTPAILKLSVGFAYEFSTKRAAVQSFVLEFPAHEPQDLCAIVIG